MKNYIFFIKSIFKTTKINRLFYISFFTLISTVHGLKAQRGVDILPLKNKNVVTVNAKGKQIKFFTLSPTEGTWFAVDGPGLLTAFLRIRLKENSTPDSVYFIKYKLDDKLVRVKKIKKVSIDEDASYEDKTIEYRPSKVKDFTIVIPPDKHIVEIFSTNPDIIIDARYTFKEGIKPVWESIKPVNNPPIELLKVVNENKSQEYYRLASNSEIKLKLDIPTTLQVYVRGEFQCDAFGNDVIRIEAYNNDILLNTYSFSCKRSNALVYEKNKDLIPGGLDKIFLDIPKGENNIKFIIKNKDKKALMRFSYDKNGELK